MKKIHSFDEVFDGQKVFRTLLEAVSNPGRVVSIEDEAQKMYGDNKAFLAVAMTLIDNEVTYNTCQNETLGKDISLLTLSREESLDKADFIFIEDRRNLPEVFENAKEGTLADPQKSATFIIKSEEEFTHDIKIYGAGIKDTMIARVPEIAVEAMELRDSRLYEYPQGVDMIFVTPAGKILAIPRLVLREGK